MLLLETGVRDTVNLV